jgi:uncharacterized protein YjdB
MTTTFHRLTLLVAFYFLALLASGCTADVELRPRERQGSSATPLKESNPRTLVSIEVTPPHTTLPASTTQSLRATAIYSDHRKEDVTSTVQWSSSSPTVASVNSAGLVIAAAPGSATIAAQIDSVKGSATIEVTNATVKSVTVTPPRRRLGKGASLQYVATATFSDHTKRPLFPPVVAWSSSSTSVATVDATGRATAVGNGNTTISATHVASRVSGTAKLNVIGATLARITIAPSSSQIPAGATEQLTATAIYSDGSTLDVTSGVVWSSSLAGVATFSSTDLGLLSAVTPGSATITARDPKSKKTATATVTVLPAALVSLAISPSAPSLAVGNSLQLTAMGTYSDGSTHDTAGAVTWSSSDPSVATVSNAVGSEGLATAGAAGVTTITATDPTTGRTQSTSLTVTPARWMTALSVAPATVSVPVGMTAQLVAQATYSDGTSADVTSLVSWSSSNAGVAVSNSAGSTGQISGGSVGWATVTATDPATSLKASANVAVTPAVLRSLSITPSSASISIGTAQSFMATGTFSDGSTHDLTYSVSWSASTNNVWFWGPGYLYGGSVGAATITAFDWVSGMSATAHVTVTPPSLVSVTVTPAAVTVPVNWQEPLIAYGHYSDGSTQNISTSVSWSSSSSAAVITPGSCSDVIVTASSVGTFTITAHEPKTGLEATAQLTATTDFTATAMVRVRFLDANGTPLTGANANAAISMGSSWGVPNCIGNFDALVATGPAGVNVSFNRADPSLVLPDNGSFSASLNVTGNVVMDITIPAATTPVHVTDPNGASVAGAIPSLFSFGGPVSCALSSVVTGCSATFSSYRDSVTGNPAQTDASGNATFYVLPIPDPTWGHISIVNVTPPPASTLLPGQAGFDASSGSVVNVQLPQGHLLHVRFLDTLGHVLTAANANLTLSAGSSWGQPDAQGSFSALVPAGTTGVAASFNRADATLALPDSGSFSVSLNLTDDLATDFTIPATTTTVHVSDPNGGSVAGAIPSLFSFGGSVSCALSSVVTGCSATFSSYRDSVTGNPAQTDASGNATFYVLPIPDPTWGHISIVNVTPPPGTDLVPGSVGFDAASNTIVEVPLL